MFESRRRRAIDRFLDDSSQRQRLLGIALQREIDDRRAKADDPDAAFQLLARMLCEQLAFMSDEMAALCKDLRSATQRVRPSALGGGSG